MARQLLTFEPWIDDSAAETCMGRCCRVRFSFLPGRHRHHCRWCGLIFCEKCAPLVPLRFGTPCLATNLREARKCNSCRLPAIFRAQRYTEGGALNARPMDVILAYLADRDVTALMASCFAAMHHFHAPETPYYEKLQDRFPTLFDGAQVGKGGCGTVYKVEDRLNEMRRVAVKVVTKSTVLSFSTWRKLLLEVDIMRGNDHPSIARLLEVFQTRTSFVMVIEAGEGGSLKRAWDIVRKKLFDLEVFTAHVVLQVSEGLDYLYRVRKIVHRDIKHDNIVLSKDFSRVMIIDFGLAEYVRNDRDQRYVPCGTMGFASPENIQAVVERKSRFPATGYAMHVSDIFSLGVVAFMLLSGQKPLKGGRFAELDQEVRRGIKCAGLRWQAVSLDARSLIELLLLTPTAQRATPAMVRAHAFISNCAPRMNDAIARHMSAELLKAEVDEGSEWCMVANDEWSVRCDEDFVTAVRNARGNSVVSLSPKQKRSGGFTKNGASAGAAPSQPNR